MRQECKNKKQYGDLKDYEASQEPNTLFFKQNYN